VAYCSEEMQYIHCNKHNLAGILYMCLEERYELQITYEAT